MEDSQRNIWWFRACFGPFLTQRGPHAPPPGSPTVPYDLVFHEMSRYNILLWHTLTVGKLGVSCMEGRQRNIWWFGACFGRFLAWRDPKRPPPGSPIVTHGRPSVPWEVEIQNCTVRRRRTRRRRRRRKKLKMISWMITFFFFFLFFEKMPQICG